MIFYDYTVQVCSVDDIFDCVMSILISFCTTDTAAYQKCHLPIDVNVITPVLLLIQNIALHCFLLVFN